MPRAFQRYELTNFKLFALVLTFCFSSVVHFFTRGSRLASPVAELSWLRAVTLISLKIWVPQEQQPAITVSS
ncbi:hypothetical protein [Bradyrhizobium sp. BWA-3-5]|uniref:hypothetical protein n=1 Tax=Bradyrhizobium sp. BWA-3-5 TaxID=3080013 RepID=UPI00293E0B29|nr:hypothetical protein [Bradyrhizobium sp. BWA-3-5]WOH67956.1 hypothetical protein RX331_09635 [Bradyrhizobium sp. BWA-3-5]